MTLFGETTYLYYKLAILPVFIRLFLVSTTVRVKNIFACKMTKLDKNWFSLAYNLKYGLDDCLIGVN